jgi:uncharacterized OB-fold protein
MSWEPRALPDVTPESERYWVGAANGELLVRECTDCDLVYHPPRALCPDCFGDAEWTTASGEGTVYSYTVAGRIDGWDESTLPAIIAYVELAEGPRMLTNVVNCEPADVAVGMAVTVAFVETDEAEVAIPVFEPAT